MKKQIMIGATALTLVVGSIGGTTSTAYAMSPFDGVTTFVERIAQKFGLKQTDVQAVVDQVRDERQGERQTEMTELIEARLSIAVKNGKLTEAQKNLILAKHKELQAQKTKDMAAWRDLSHDQRRSKMDEQRVALEAWAKQNNIDTKYLNTFGLGDGKGMGKGFGGGRLDK